MFQQTLMFLASDSPPAQAVSQSPPAKSLPGRAGNLQQTSKTGRITLALNVVGNAVGFALLMAGLWFSLWLMQALVPVAAL